MNDFIDNTINHLLGIVLCMGECLGVDHLLIIKKRLKNFGNSLFSFSFCISFNGFHKGSKGKGEKEEEKAITKAKEVVILVLFEFIGNKTQFLHPKRMNQHRLPFLRIHIALNHLFQKT